MRSRLVLLIGLFSALLCLAGGLCGSPLAATPASAVFSHEITVREGSRMTLAETGDEPPPYTALTAAALTTDLAPYTAAPMCASALLTLLRASR